MTQTQPTTDAPVDTSSLPVSRDRLNIILDSANFWVEALPQYANRFQAWADSWAILAGVIASITSVALWPVLSETSTWKEKAVISAGALIAAICALVPRIMNFGEFAGQARELGTSFGGITGTVVDLLDLQDDAFTSVTMQRIAHSVTSEFLVTKGKKDGLRYLPTPVKIERKKQQRLEAEKETLLAKKNLKSAKEALRRATDAVSAGDRLSASSE